MGEEKGGGERILVLLICLIGERLECMNLLAILTTYERASAQQVNQDKTTLSFSKFATQEMQELIKDTLGVSAMQQTKSTWDYHLLLVRRRKSALITSGNVFGRNFKDGRGNCYLKRVEKS